MIKLVVFDYDSTLVDAESLDFLASRLGLGEKIASITNKAMAGKLDFYESLQARMTFFKNIPYEKIINITSQIPLMKGSKTLINHLKTKGKKVVVFSGGFEECINTKKLELGFDTCFANTLYIKNSLFSGKIGGEMMFDDSKGKMLLKLKSVLGLKREEIAVVGDGANDISMFKQAGLSVAFNAKEVLKPYATFIENDKDLSKLKGVLDG